MSDVAACSRADCLLHARCERFYLWLQSNDPYQNMLLPEQVPCDEFIGDDNNAIETRRTKAADHPS
jgi:hypothetical protein